jgi:hypothetical protein
MRHDNCNLALAGEVNAHLNPTSLPPVAMLDFPRL